MKIIGQLNEEQLKLYNEGNKSVVLKKTKKILSEGSKNKNPESQFPETMKLMTEYLKKLKNLKEKFEKEKNNLGDPVVMVCKKEIKLYRKNNAGINDIEQDIADALYYILEGEEGLMDRVL